MTYGVEGSRPYVRDLLAIHLEAAFRCLGSLASHLKCDWHEDLILPRTLVAVATSTVLVVASPEATISISASVVVVS